MLYFILALLFFCALWKPEQVENRQWSKLWFWKELAAGLWGGLVFNNMSHSDHELMKRCYPVKPNSLQLSHFIKNVPVNLSTKTQSTNLFLSDAINNLWIQGMWINKMPCAHFTGSGQAKLHFFTISTLKEIVKVYSNLMMGAGQRSAGSLRSPEKNQELSQWLSALFVYGHCCLSAQGQNTAGLRSCPWSLWTVASHTPVGASRPQGLTVTVWAGKHREMFCPALSPNPPKTFHYSWIKNNPFKQAFCN